MPSAVADNLAEALVRAAAGQRQAGRILHDDIGPLLSAAGLRLQLLRMDFPDASERAQEVMQTLDDALEKMRALSQELSPSPVYRTGFKNALASLVETSREEFAGGIRFTFSSPVRLPVETAVAMYDATAIALEQAIEDRDTKRIDLSVTGTKNLRVRIKDNGKSRRALAMAALLARHAGLTFEVSAGEGTIVCIEHAFRRPSRG